VPTEAGLFLGVPFVYEHYVQADASNSTLLVTDSIPGCVFPEQKQTMPPLSPQDFPSSSPSSIDDDDAPSTSASIGTTTMREIPLFAFWMMMYYIFF